MSSMAVPGSQIMSKDSKPIATSATITPDRAWDVAVRFVQLQAKRGADRVSYCALAGQQSIDYLRSRASAGVHGDGGALTLFSGSGDVRDDLQVSQNRLLEASRTDPLSELPAPMFFQIPSSHPRLK